MTTSAVTGRRAAHLALVVAGLVILGFALWRFANPTITCRGQVMHAGDVCHKNGYSSLGSPETQTYESRLSAQRTSQPVMMVVGLAVAGFGGALYRQDRRRTV